MPGLGGIDTFAVVKVKSDDFALYSSRNRGHIGSDPEADESDLWNAWCDVRGGARRRPSAPVALSVSRNLQYEARCQCFAMRARESARVSFRRGGGDVGGVRRRLTHVSKLVASESRGALIGCNVLHNRRNG